MTTPNTQPTMSYMRVKFTGDGADYQGENPHDKSVVHLNGCITDYTLCGLTLDGDDGTTGNFEAVKSKVTCEQCLTIIKYCKGFKQ